MIIGTEVNFDELQVKVPKDSYLYDTLACSSHNSESAMCCTLAAMRLQRREVAAPPWCRLCTKQLTWHNVLELE